MINQEFEESNKFKNRVIPGIIISVIFLIILSIAIVGGNTQNDFSKPLRIIAYIIFSFIFVLMSYELYKSFVRDLFFSVGLAILSTVIMVFPIDTIKTFVNNQSSEEIVNTMASITKQTFSDYYSVIAILVISLLYIAHRFIFVSNVNKKNILIKSLIIFITIYAIQISFKLLVFSTKFDVRFISLFLGAAVLSDITGFFTGSVLGQKFIKRKLAPAFSPKKTWEGAIGSYIVALIFISAFVFAEKLYGENNSIQGFSVIILPVLPIIGDLSFSIIKRINSIKDFSKILKGHGGLLDRYDSICVISFFGFLFLLSTT